MILYSSIVFLPLVGFLITGLFGKRLGYYFSGFFTSALIVIAAVLSWYLFLTVNLGDSEKLILPLFEWVTVGSFIVDWSLRLDSLSIVMLVVVNTISALVHIYSISYMHDDESGERFFAYLSFFTFAMLSLVTANNLLQLFFGWEAVGLVSYLLIGFWYKKSSATTAAFKAFVTNRIGDFGFLLGIFGVFVVFGSLNLDEIFSAATNYFAISRDNFVVLGKPLSAELLIDIICFCLFLGAMSKSAQLFLHVWLPDAMEGPTPVSALLHAATMVVAGVFMVARLAPVFELSTHILTFIMVLGSCTALFGATVAVAQTDIKRIVAYSTCSHLGYMFAALGAGAISAGMFHLFTHAFFKALLFMGAGSVIHAIAGEQDIRKMGGLYRYLPLTYSCMLIATLSAVGLGIPGTSFGMSGFLSKDAIIGSVFNAGSCFAIFSCILLIITAFFTSFYSWRLMFVTFHGTSRLSVAKRKAVHEASWLMLVPLILLSLGAIFCGVIFERYFVGSLSADFWAGVFSGFATTLAHNKALFFVEISVVLAMLLGFILALVMYILLPNSPVVLANKFKNTHKFLLNKWYFDELYSVIFVRPLLSLGNFLSRRMDVSLDKWGANGLSSLVVLFTKKVSKFQTGYIYHYAFVMLTGLALFLTWLILGNLK